MAENGFSADRKSHVVVVGAGWAGWGATKALCEAGVRVTLIDGMADPSGSEPITTESGKPFEAGTRGFWKDYPNINALTDQLGLGSIYTDFTTSAFWSPDGLEATAPVFGDAPQLPSPVGQVLATVKNFKRLPLPDRFSIAGLLYAMLDLNRSDAVYRSYDAIDALTLFRQLRISDRMIDDFLRPTLLVGLFKPPEELSAAVTMELLYYYALAHQDSFDVRWIRSKSIAEQLIAPLSARLQAQHQLEVLGGTLATRLNMSADGQSIRSLETRNVMTGSSAVLDDVDALVLAVGAKGMGALMAQSPQCGVLAPELVQAGTLGTIDVVSVRLWLDRYVPVADPANVFSRFSALQGSGATFFMLDQLQKAAESALWGGQTPQGSVIASDFYNASVIAELSDQQIVDCLMQDLLPMAQPAFGEARVLDQEVRRYPGSVSLFSPGSFSKRPPLETSLAPVVCAGDWVRMGEREHGAKGLCQERAYVCGLEAGNSLLRRGIVFGEGVPRTKQHPVIPIRSDEPQVLLGRALNKLVMEPLETLGIDWPWLEK
ncbi:FAD-dependent pyridine nucleotide-disulfide oxidoreductase [Synechococcus sp. BIOS-E4-1]|uniref:hydroxysqualene dehydroxylase n=1 Tax=Synechococcus sp. BIOS-E4-1 TaxID=1400864 RepID=UPI0016465EAB|nr:FAD-dependent oxidoreductase [Synechococcus sp. BIOS-E4-1]QNI53902.1 FAD-dependent pyridine nucleotide-disulfide oxidoreductase [Synechococcus sp. BIOS-E4-1]